MINSHIYPKLWLVWAILSPLLLSISFALASFVNTYFLLFEYIFVAFYSLYLFKKEDFKNNFYKLTFLTALTAGLIFIFGITYVWLTILILLLAMKILNFSKEEFFYSFGMLFIYGVLGIILLFALTLFNSIENIEAKGLELFFDFIVIILFSSFIRGSIFGEIVHRFLLKKR